MPNKKEQMEIVSTAAYKLKHLKWVIRMWRVTVATCWRNPARRDVINTRLDYLVGVRLKEAERSYKLELGVFHKLYR